ncbi:hypothetical protein SAMN04488057_109117 [Cyclobacterium lianum]|uniref:Uncharacterized protein n=1 Tax=Cyclobacterium lianum TaxID=388280 RepID=A0A1M7PLN7_9BACT|nr:hypothetical protein [Cyclobacterium lianum]SHN17965.1 hypothetical protein SAMN04488057_109117 [Cyclobacterium lianum]
MNDYKAIEAHCRVNSAISAKVLDEFLLYYAAQKNKLDREADLRLGTYRHITQTVDKSWYNLLKSQYIIHKVLKDGGLIHKYLSHVAVKNLEDEQRAWLGEQAAIPWRFSFSRVLDSPQAGFYNMEDVFTEEKYLLYSPGMADISKDGDIELWFNLIAFNGSCWQTYGPLAGYRSFSADDIFFYATEVNSSISDEEELMQDVDKNPVPYMMLFGRSNYPLTIHEGQVLELVLSELDDIILNEADLENEFEVDRIDMVYRIKLPGMENKPHFAAAYYDQEAKFLQVTAMTETGYMGLVKAFKKLGVSVGVPADIYVRPSMLTAAQEILKKEIELMPYELLFEEDLDQEDPDVEMKKLNELMALALPYINAGKEPDLEALADEVGLDLEGNREVITALFDDIKQKRKG